MLSTDQSGLAIPSSRGPLLPWVSVLGGSRAQPGWALEMSHGQLGPLGHNKAPFCGGTKSRSEPTLGQQDRLTPLSFFEWQAVQDMGLIVILCSFIQGSRAGPRQAEEGGRSSCPPGERYLRALLWGEEVPPRPWPLSAQGSCRPDHRGPHGLQGSREGMTKLSLLLALLQDPGQTNQHL